MTTNQHCNVNRTDANILQQASRLRKQTSITDVKHNGSCPDRAKILHSPGAKVARKHYFYSHCSLPTMFDASIRYYKIY